MSQLAVYRFRVVTVLLFMLLVVFGATQAHAQQVSLTGTVVDPAGGAVQNATVTATNDASSAQSKAVTDAEGKFSIANLPAGAYTVNVSAAGFAVAERKLQISAEHSEPLTVSLALGSLTEAITVEANSVGSVAAEHAPMDGLLEARSARTEVTPVFIQNYTSPAADFGELVEMAPGTFSINSNGIGLGQDKTYFRGFPDGDYDIDFDEIPFYDTNTPTHHSWAFFPSPWVGSVDFDRSPGSASTIGPTPFGGSIHLLSPDMKTSPLFLASVSYGSFNTMLLDANYDSGLFWNKKSNVLVDVQHFTSDGYETNNYQTRNAGSLKYMYKFSETNTLTGYSGVVWLDSNTPNNSPTRGQIATYGDNFLLSSDFNSAELNASGACINPANCLYPLNYKFYTYHVPTDFEYVGWSRQWGAGWMTDFRPYTLSYYNAQYYNNPSYKSDGLTFSGSPVSATSAVDKLNSYRKYGETFTASQVSRWGIFRTGLWYEWATTNRYQIPSNPVTLVDTTLPNFHEKFYTNTYQPFAEYQFRATQRLTVTGGFKYARFTQDLTQFQDNGKYVGCGPGGVNVGGKTGYCVGGGAIHNYAGYNAYLPSADANYHIKSNWSAYFQYGTGTVVPPSGVFDVTGASVVTLPKPTGVTTYQSGTVLKLKQVTINADLFRTRYANAYSAVTDPYNTTAYDWISSGDAVTKGFEGEANVYLTRGLSFYVNGTAGNAKYVSTTLPNAQGVQVVNQNYGKWVANTPANTEAFGLTWQQKHYEMGIFDKRVGPMWNDNTPYNQVIPIAPFSLTNVYLNYVIANGSHFDQTKFRLSVNNLFDNHNIVGVAPFTAGSSTFTTSAGDQLTTLPGRSITMTVTLGVSPKR